MKRTLIAACALALSIALPGAVMAQDQTQDRDQLQDCGALGEKDCADLLRIRDQLKDCDGVTSDDCAALLRERDRLQDCATPDQDRDQTKDQTKDQDRDCAPDSAGSGGTGKN